MKRPIQRILFAAILTASITLSYADLPCAQEDGSPVSIGTYRTLHSNVLDEDRSLLISLPGGYDETAVRYPVLFILYGGQVRGYFAEAVHVVDRLQEAGLIPQLILVGVENVDRYRDNLPVNRDGGEGGAGRFLEFFTEELIPFVNESYRTKDFRILLGPQAGASFGLYALMERPGLFRVNIVTNPFWNRSVREYLLARADDFFRREGPLDGLLFVTCNTSADNEDTMEYLERLAVIVEQGNRSDFTMLLNRVGQEDRGIIPSPGLKEGLKAYFKDYRLAEDTEVTGLDDLVSYYRQISEDYGYEVDIPEFTLIRQGGRLEEGGKPGEAKILYEYVLEHYPHNLNSYHRLGELHRRQGDYRRAIEYYEQFLQRRPEEFFEQRLNSLRRYVNESAAHAVEAAILGSGTDGGISRYRELKADDQTDLYFDENEFNALGYNLISRGMIQAAIEVFKMNVEMYPESANAHDSLGEAYMLDDNREEALRSYKRSLELNPDNENAEQKLENLQSR